MLVTAMSDSKYLFGVKDVSIIFKSVPRLDLSTLINNIEFQTSKTLITELEAKKRWFSLNEAKLKSINSRVDISWFEIANFNAGSEDTLGKIDIFATWIHYGQFKNTVTVSIKTIIKQTGSIDTAVGNGTGKISDQQINYGITKIVQLKNGIILIGANMGLFRSTDVDEINDISFNSSNNILNHNVTSITQLANGNVLVITNDGSIYQLTAEGKIDTSVGGGTGNIEVGIHGYPRVIVQLSNGTILVGTSNGLIYKLTDEDKIDHSVGDGTGKLEDKIFDHLIIAIIELPNRIVLASTGNIDSTGTKSSIYRLVL
ncbi:hypothetical protein [Spiroplasma endosymbiont of Labia minor]|uniref:hypothetical protein n=1 Tax=Spiroplasma endosymbiont of Labia minor TaxID=3066305 RepID=UPI0030CB80D6